MTKVPANSKLGAVLGTTGAVGAAIYCFKKGHKIGKAALLVGIFGIGGLLIGNAVTKFYE